MPKKINNKSFEINKLLNLKKEKLIIGVDKPLNFFRIIETKPECNIFEESRKMARIV